MGATLPAMARWVETTPEGVSWLGFFYGGNIAGAVIGCLLAGFYLLRVHDMRVATFVAVALNVLVAGARAGDRADRSPHEMASQRRRPPSSSRKGALGRLCRHRPFGLHGARRRSHLDAHLSLLFGATVYTFSLILAVFLFGLGIGSSLGSAHGRTHRAAARWRSAGARCCSARRWPGPRTC